MVRKDHRFTDRIDQFSARIKRFTPRIERFTPRIERFADRIRMGDTQLSDRDLMHFMH